MDDLQLDEMLGEETIPIQIRSGRYSLRTMNALSPMDFWRVMTRGNQLAGMTEAEAKAREGEVLQGMDEVFEVIAPSIPRYKPSWLERMRGRYVKRFDLSLLEYLSILQLWIRLSNTANDDKEVSNEEETDLSYADLFVELSFWYHLSHAEICNMPMSAIKAYMGKLPKQKAKQRLMLAEGASVPRMTKESHREWFAAIDDVLNDGKRPVKVMTPAMMAMIGIGVEVRKKVTNG